MEKRFTGSHHVSYWNRTSKWVVNENEANLLRYFGQLSSIDIESLTFGGRDNRSLRLDSAGTLEWVHDPADSVDGKEPRSIWETLPALSAITLLQNLLRAFFPSSIARGGGAGFTRWAFEKARAELNGMLKD